MSTTSQIALGNPCRILSLDGGGAKGFYTLGVLAQVEAMLKGKLLCEHFDLIFGTSMGAIIAALLSLGYNVGDILSLYRQHVPTIMKNSMAGGRTKALDKLVAEVFGDRDFTHVKTGVGTQITTSLDGLTENLRRSARPTSAFLTHVRNRIRNRI